MSKEEIDLIEITRSDGKKNPKDRKKNGNLKNTHNNKDTKYPVKQNNNRFKKLRTRIGVILTAAFTAIGGLFMHNYNEKLKNERKDVIQMIDNANLKVGRRFKNLNPDNMGPILKMYMDALYKKYPNLDTIINTDDSEAHYPGFNEDIYGLLKAYLLDQAGVDVPDLVEEDDTINLSDFNRKYNISKLHYDDGDCLYKRKNQEDEKDVYSSVYDDEYFYGDEGEIIYKSKDLKVMALTNAYYEALKGHESEILGTGNNVGSLAYETLEDIVGTREEIPPSEVVNQEVDRRIDFADRMRAKQNNNKHTESPDQNNNKHTESPDHAENFYKEIGSVDSNHAGRDR